MAWKAVLFDMDGVLIDSEEYMAKTGVRALKKYGINAKESDFAEFVGCGENRYVGGVAEKYGVPYRTEMKYYLYTCYGEQRKQRSRTENLQKHGPKRRGRSQPERRWAQRHR